MFGAEDALRHGSPFAQQRLGFFEATQIKKIDCVVAGFSDGFFMFFAAELDPYR